MTYQQFREWWVYFTVDPFGELRQDLRHGRSDQLSMMPHMREGAALPEVDKLMVNFDREVDQIDDKELLSQIRQYKKEETARKEHERNGTPSS